MRYYLLDNGLVEKRTSRPSNALAEVPSHIDMNDYSYLKVETVVDDQTGSQIISVAVDDIKKGQVIHEQNISNEKTRLHSEYITDINTEMLNIFGTTDRAEASALYNTYKEWKEDPSFFSAKGLVDEHGAALDTASKVSIYAQQKIEQCKDYSVFLIQRKKQFKDAVALLEA